MHYKIDVKMECIYLPELNTNNKYYQISNTEAHHLKVLRVQSETPILVTSGKGLSALSTINRISKNDFSISIIEYYYNKGEVNFKIGLAISILDNRDRFEFAIEKSTELGVSDIFPLITDYSQQSKINKDRLIIKTINAIKQCKRSILPTIYNPMSIAELLNNNNYNRIILADEYGITPEIKLKEPTDSIIFIGSEGGFSKNELDIFDKKNIIKWNLGNRRLRAETSAITGISLLSFGF
jgi:16S rRNA (uracil1498-N3)-methyltransferase